MAEADMQFRCQMRVPEYLCMGEPDLVVPEKEKIIGDESHRGGGMGIAVCGLRDPTDDTNGAFSLGVFA
jgi:hypothetical protein